MTVILDMLNMDIAAGLAVGASAIAIGVALARWRGNRESRLLGRGICPDCGSRSISLQPRSPTSVTAYCYGCASAWLVESDAGQPIVRLGRNGERVHYPTIRWDLDLAQQRVRFSVDRGFVLYDLADDVPMSLFPMTASPKELLTGLVQHGVVPIDVHLDGVEGNIYREFLDYVGIER